MSEIETLLDEAHSLKRIYFLGGTDTGKTTLIALLAKEVSKSERIALLDIDVGQSHIGPPTTVGLSLLEGRFVDWENAPLSGIHFIGSTSPEGHLLQTVVGSEILIRECGGRRVLVDSPGYIFGGPAIALHHHLIQTIEPDLIVAVERTDELYPILRPFEGFEKPRVHRRKPDERVVRKSFEERALYRFSRYRSYFADSAVAKFPFEQVSLIRGRAELLRALVSLRSEPFRDDALGIIEEVDRQNARYLVRTPLSNCSAIRTIIAGDIRLDKEYNEIPPGG